MKNTVIITGAGGALGASVNQAFADAGWSLVCWEYSEDSARSLREVYPDALVVRVDLTDPDDAERALAETLLHTDRVDALVCLAGGFGMADAAEATPKDLDRMLDLNVRTLVHSVQRTLPVMLEQGSGFVLGVAAAAAEQGGAGMALYAASKAAVAIYLKSLRDELSDQGIRVATLFPMAALDTEANRDAMPDADPASMIDTDELATTIVHMASRSGQGHTGEVKVYPVTGG